MSVENEMLARLTRIEEALGAQARLTERMGHSVVMILETLIESAEPDDVGLALDGSRNGAERDPNQPL